MDFLINYSSLISNYISYCDNVLMELLKKQISINPELIIKRLLYHLDIKYSKKKIYRSYDSLKVYKTVFTKIYKSSISKERKQILLKLLHYLTTVRIKIYNIILLMNAKSEKINLFSLSDDRCFTDSKLKKPKPRITNSFDDEKTEIARKKLLNITKKIKRLEDSESSEINPSQIIKNKYKNKCCNELNKYYKQNKSCTNTKLLYPTQSCCPPLPPPPPECDINLDCQNFNILKCNLHKIFKIFNVMRYVSYNLISSFNDVLNKFNYVTMGQTADSSDVDHVNKLIDIFASQFCTFADKISVNPSNINFGCCVQTSPPTPKVREFSLLLCGRLIIVCVIDCFGISKPTTDPPTLVISTKNSSVTLSYVKFDDTYGQFSAILLANTDAIKTLISLINSNQNLIQNGIDHIEQLICLEQNDCSTQI